MLRSIARVIAMALALATTASAGDWPQWLGPARNGSSTEKVEAWPDPPAVVWRQAIGSGYSSPVVAGGRAFVHARAGQLQEEEVVAFDAVTGKGLWRDKSPRATYNSVLGGGPAATPTVAGNKIFSYGISGLLSCHDADTGKRLWQRDIYRELNVSIPRYGVCCSPLVIGSHVLVSVGGKDSAIVAVDAQSGEVAWKAFDEPATTASPILYRAPGQDATEQTALFVTSLRLLAIDPLATDLRCNRMTTGNPMIDLVVLQEPASPPLPEVSAEPVRFHLSLNVSNLSDAVAFYRVLFDQAPAKHHRDYAKFDVQQPPVVFSLVPRAPTQGGSLSHLGLRVPDRALLDIYRSRLEAASICTSNQDATVCGYAKQDKLWLRDPDGNFWEIYHIEEDVAPESVRQSLSGTAARMESPKSPTTWEHYITTPLPESIPLADRTLDEVLLTGTFNADTSEESLQSIVREACRVLKPGGRLSTHGLMGNAAIDGDIALPGMAALVQRVPNYLDVMQRLRAAGFVNVEITKFTDKPWFELNGVALREVKVDAYRPPESQAVAERTVLYRGPFTRLVTDGGSTFVRGQRTAVDADVWDLLRHGTSAESFVFFETEMSGSCSASSKG